VENIIPSGNNNYYKNNNKEIDHRIYLGNKSNKNND